MKYLPAWFGACLGTVLYAAVVPWRDVLSMETFDAIYYTSAGILLCWWVDRTSKGKGEGQ